MRLAESCKIHWLIRPGFFPNVMHLLESLVFLFPSLLTCVLYGVELGERTGLARGEGSEECMGEGERGHWGKMGGG